MTEAEEILNGPLKFDDEGEVTASITYWQCNTSFSYTVQNSYLLNKDTQNNTVKQLITVISYCCNFCKTVITITTVVLTVVTERCCIANAINHGVRAKYEPSLLVD